MSDTLRYAFLCLALAAFALALTYLANVPESSRLDAR